MGGSGAKFKHCHGTLV
ncbi:MULTISPECIES: SEC-C metal-binding domain-containing protein [Asticcacaulis]